MVNLIQNNGTGTTYAANMPSRRALAYYRTSNDPTEVGRSNERQQSEAHQTADREALTLAPADEFQDVDSASIFGTQRGVEREGWQRLLDTLDREGDQIHTVILSEVSRGTREQVEYQRLAQLCIKHKVIINAKGKNLDPADETDSFQLGLEVLLAAQEAQRISNRVKKGVIKSVADGRPPAGRVPFGYFRPPRDIGEKARQFKHKKNALLVEVAANGIIADEISLGDVERLWNEAAENERKELLEALDEQAVTNHWEKTDTEYTRRKRQIERRNKWNTSSVRKALMNPSLIGRRVVGSGTVQGNWEAILDDDTYYTLYGKLTDPERRTSPGPESKTLLAAVAMCAVCGDKLRTKGDSYTCRAKYCVVKKQGWCDVLATEACIAYLGASLRDEISNTIRGYDPEVTNAGDFETATAKLKTAREQLSEFQAEASKQGLSAAIVVSTLVSYNQQVEEAEAELEALARTSTTRKDPLLEELREVVTQLNLERMSIDPTAKDMTPTLVELQYGDEIREMTQAMWDEAELTTRRGWLIDGFTIKLHRAPTQRRIDLMNPAILTFEPRTGWDAIGDTFRPWWSKPGSVGTVGGVVVKIPGDVPKSNPPKRDTQ
ncbi:recombinase family protein [Amycolatopsis regifaucium]|uniref:Resolvase/invertase-type recombinase catalytic domain-containing protein n=1 Tax=Amycolatopsis regifaucium TaxID=546365 RepID=A0A154M9T3_9PSEU|nr:recombinase family protein [Amycolatopsis regifaucium]KZB81371.1 hypothetical protein AVL48_04955 [Amycolatopsis regifaucium]OKA04634.1 hypothetical protein ATP06_0229965 [Amycolatopsis regifaucium]SFH33289.1 Site-specific DNA recombinase [Amycolatopsis regifaucium]